MRRLSRHLVIGFIAAWFPALFLPFAQSMVKSLEGLELTAMAVSFAIWATFSCFIKRRDFRPWLLVGFASPFIGLPLVVVFAQSDPVGTAAAAPEAARNVGVFGDIWAKLLFGFVSATFLSMFTIPIGILMGMVAYMISRLFHGYETKFDAKPDRVILDQSIDELGENPSK